jgi:multidrug efflux system outer membrane protein
MRKTLLIFGLILTSLFGGCSLAPKYARPEAPVPAGWPTGAAYKEIKAATVAPVATELMWQEFFTDENLKQVIGMALTNNRDLRLAALNMERARALYGIQRAALLPTLDATGSGSKQRTFINFSGSRQTITTEQYSVDLGITSWEIDFFGRIRSLKDRALEEYLASEQAHRSSQILLVSEVANAYLTLAADRENLNLTQSTLDTQQAAYDLIRRRYETGLVPELDLRQAQTRVDAARVDALLFTQLVAQDETALNLLVGSTVPSELLPATLSSVSQPKDVSPGVSSEVLLRRPDVLQAESLLRAAHADIGAARAAFFPRISLTAAVGTASGELSGLFQSGSGTWIYAPQVVVPIFDARTWSALRVTKVQREIALAQYEKAIQNAFKEVADALAVQGTIEEQLSAQQSLANATTETYRLSNARYMKGIDNYLVVIDAQRSLYVAQLRLVSLRLTRFANQVRLYAVLGGGGDFPKRTEP